MTIAVTGATGYLGTHMLLCLMDRGEDAIGFAAEGELPPALAGKVPLETVALDDSATLSAKFSEHRITGIIHFAGDGTIPASLIDPLKEYERTLVATLTMLRAASNARCEHVVFSSTASVYGVPDRMPIREETPLNSISPYGAAMAMAERIVTDSCRPACLSTAILRYFNVAGADPKLRAGEAGHPRHLIKAAAQIATGILDEPLKIYGDDYDTPDGTAIRDYIHVSDMAEAHAAALDHLVRGGDPVILNCGYGEGVSVRDVIEAVQRVSGEKLDTMASPRRPGDPPILIADTAAIRSVLGWSPRYDDIDQIVRTAIEWEKKDGGLAPQ
ncbi:UDP-glucose 4-epimerase GalE [Parvularcula marina]|uniref:UDP-glucose 4-epimerase GalE n=1 Tax=Parvularcula marina TaxID=2292771 RepID=UPI0035153D14